MDKYERQVGQEGQPDLLIGRISQLYVDSLEPKDVQGTHKEVVEKPESSIFIIIVDGHSDRL